MPGVPPGRTCSPGEPLLLARSSCKGMSPGAVPWLRPGLTVPWGKTGLASRAAGDRVPVTVNPALARLRDDLQDRLRAHSPPAIVAATRP